MQRREGEILLDESLLSDSPNQKIGRRSVAIYEVQ